MRKKINIKFIILIIILINLFLNIYGNSWGLPSRWHSDEKVSNVLHMLHERTFIDARGFFYQPTGYNIVLGIWLVPHFLFLKVIGFPIESVKDAASLSWSYMAQQFPDFTTWLYLYARLLSALLGALTVYILFLLAKKIYSEKAALFSAAFLSVCMGFVAVNHFAKYPALLNLLVLLTLLICITALDKKNIRDKIRYFYLCSFVAGLAVSVKFSAFLLAVPIFITFLFIAKGHNISLRAMAAIFVKTSILFLAGLVLLTPSLATNLKDYFFRTKTLIEAKESGITEALFSVAGSHISYFLDLVRLMGIGISFLVFIGLIYAVANLKKMSKKEAVVLSFMAVYWIVMTSVFKGPQSKYISAIVAPLLLYAGRGMDEIFNIKRLHYFTKCAVFLAVFIFSFSYTYASDVIFLKGDTRYASTKWIKENISLTAKIEMFDQIHLLAKDSVLQEYNVILLGRSSKEFKGGVLPRWIDIEDRQKYIEKLNKKDSDCDYIILSISNMDDLDSGKYLGYLPGISGYVKGLFDGKKNFVLVKTFKPDKRQVVINKRLGVIVPQNIFWNPIPDFESVSPSIYIFKRKQ